MADDDTHRSIRIESDEFGIYRAINSRGGVIEMGRADSTRFTPVELLLAAIGGCTGIDVDMITAHRVRADGFRITVQAEKVRDATDGNHLRDIDVTFDLTFPPGESGDAARTVLPEAIRRSHERLCTVSRTVSLGTPVSMHTVD